MSTRNQIHKSSLVAQMVKKICLQGQETRVHPWVRKIPLEKATSQAHSGNVETEHQGLCLTALQRGSLASVQIRPPPFSSGNFEPNSFEEQAAGSCLPSEQKSHPLQV